MKTLADILADAQLVAPDRLAAAVRRAQSTGEPLLVILTEGERISEDTIAAALSRALGRPPLPAIGDIDDEALREVPYDLARGRRMCPLDLTPAGAGPPRLRVAMADPTDREGIESLEQMSGCRVEPVLARLSAVDAAVRRAYRGVVTAVMKRPFGLPALTQPGHRLEDELPLELRHRALLELLVGKGLISLDEYAREVRRLAGERE
jgi:hypothetical protein